MPSCFQLIDRVTEEPASLSLVDDRICKEVYNNGDGSSSIAKVGIAI